MREKWKSVPGWPYEISNTGRVRREENKCLLKSNPHTGGYLQVVFHNKGQIKNGVIHRLVLEAFVGPRPEGYEANHKDGNKLNNCVENLEWVSHSENMLHAFSLGLKQPMIGSQHGRAKLDEEAVLKIRKLRRDRKHTQVELSRLFGVSTANISLIVNRKIWCHVGLSEGS